MLSVNFYVPRSVVNLCSTELCAVKSNLWIHVQVCENAAMWFLLRWTLEGLLQSLSWPLFLEIQQNKSLRQSGILPLVWTNGPSPRGISPVPRATHSHAMGWIEEKQMPVGVVMRSRSSLRP